MAGPAIFLLVVFGLPLFLVGASLGPALRLGPATDVTAPRRARLAKAWAVGLNLAAAIVTPFTGYTILLFVPLAFLCIAAAVAGLAGRRAFLWGALGCTPFPFLAIAYGYATEPERMTNLGPMLGYLAVLYLAGLLGAGIATAMLTLSKDRDSV